MMISLRTGMAGFFFAALATLSACSDSTSVAPNEGFAPEAVTPQVPDGGSSVAIPEGPVMTEEPVTELPTVSGDSNPVSQNPEQGDPVLDDPAMTDPVLSPEQVPGIDEEPLTEVTATGSDLSGGDDDSPTAVETLSLAGPFIKDTSRSAGPPSAPTDLTLLLSAENWLEFSWSPSSDDQSVEAYEIYRDGQLLFTVRGDTGYEFDYRSWISTSYIDCNYTRYTDCEGRSPVSGSSYAYTVVAVDNEGMRSPSSTAAVFTLSQRSSDPVDLSAYSKVFDESFDGEGLDRNRWKTALPWGPDEIINRETQYFVNIFGNTSPDYDPFVFTGETLQITGIKTPDSLLAQSNNQPYLSGVITSSDYFEMTYGYVEMSAKVAGGQGLLSTFYLFNQDFEKNKPEIDILEYIGSRPDKAYQTYHYYDSNRARYASGEKHSSPTMEYSAGPDLSSGFHTYGVLWEPGLIIWYIDGIETRRLTGPRVSDEPMNIIAHLVIGSEWIGAPDEATLPAVFEIDYIRAWQK
ncbi:MAG: family 16 glycosylhydrolase [Granulosicoccus sp.]